MQAKAYPILKHIYEIEDSLSTKSLLQSVTVAHDKYLQEQKDYAEYKIKTNRIFYAIAAVFTLILIIYISKLLTTEKKSHSKTLNSLSQTEEKLTKANEQINTYEETIHKIITNDDTKTFVYLIGKIMKRYYAPEYRVLSFEEAIGDLVKEYITAENFKDCIINYADFTTAGAVTKFKGAIKNVKDEDLLLFALYSIDIDYNAISTITGKSPNTLYTRYKRYREAITNSTCDDKEFILNFLKKRPTCAIRKKNPSA